MRYLIVTMRKFISPHGISWSSWSLQDVHGIFLGFLGKKVGFFEDWGHVIIVLEFTHIVQQLLFSLFSSILMFDFDLILGMFLTFWDTNGLFLGSKTVLEYTHLVEKLLFLMIP